MQMKIVMLVMGMLLSSMLIAIPAQAAWRLNNDQSILSFISIKASDIAEVHHFNTLAGMIEDDGSVNVEIELASVDTLIPIRDQRMREVLFETNAFPIATVTAKIDPALAENLRAGEVTTVTAEVLVELHGEAAPMVIELDFVSLTDTRILVSSQKPVIVNAGMFNLVDGIEQLRQIAGLPSISKAVPVSFRLIFDQDN
jgi:polyisoprenoid-binding protein YceI